MTQLDHAWAIEELQRRLRDGTLQTVLGWVEQHLPPVETAIELMQSHQLRLVGNEWLHAGRTVDKLKFIRRRLRFLQSRLNRMINP